MEMKKKAIMSEKRSEQETQRKKRSDLHCSQSGLQLSISFHPHMAPPLGEEEGEGGGMKTSEDR